MKPALFHTPVLFLIFNRPEPAREVFKLLQDLRPKYLYISADGPRENKVGENEKCNQARDVINSIDWECEIKTRFLDQNKGCKLGVSSGISWFFDHVEKGIILEDDCKVDPSFFKFSAELLEKYRGNEKVMHISASNFQGQSNIDESYYFSQYNHIWGWASWRRAWKHYDVTLAQTTRSKFKKTVEKLFDRKIDIPFWLSMFDYAKSKHFTTWDFQWTFSIWLAGGISITPKGNLVSNIGFGEDATNTQSNDSSFANQRNYPMKFPLLHPAIVEANKNLDRPNADALYLIEKNAHTFNLKIRIARLLPIGIRNKIKRII